MLSSAQTARIHTLLQRLQKLEDIATTRNVIAVPQLSRANEAFKRAKALEARITRLELIESIGEEGVKQIMEVESRLNLLENGVTKLNTKRVASPNVLRVETSLLNLGIDPLTFSFYRVPDGRRYYEEMNLEERARLLRAPGPSHLCKTLLLSLNGGRMDNNIGEDQEKNIEENDQDIDEKNDQFVLLVIPYDSKIDSTKLRAALKAKNLLIPKKNPCMASPGRAEQLLGFPFNGVSVVGGSSPKAKTIPIIFAEVITKLTPPTIFLGGGEMDVKLQLNNVTDFIQKTNSFVMDVTEQRLVVNNKIIGVLEPAKNLKPSSLATKVESSSPTKPSSPKGNSQKRKQDQATTEEEEDESGGGGGGSFDFDDLDVRVGLVTKAWRHPESAKLMCEEIDVGEATGPRSIASGIQAYYTPEEFTGKLVCVITNLKPAKLGGFMSNGMVFCASWKGENDQTFVRLVEPPKDSKIGTRIVVNNSSPEKKQPATSTAVKKKKIFEQVKDKLFLDSEGKIVLYDGKPIVTVEGKDGFCIVTNGAPNAQVS